MYFVVVCRWDWTTARCVTRSLALLIAFEAIIRLVMSDVVCENLVLVVQRPEFGEGFK
jgi:hypothetical protein